MSTSRGTASEVFFGNNVFMASQHFNGHESFSFRWCLDEYLAQGLAMTRRYCYYIGFFLHRLFTFS